ncbi:MAG: hypothetical protein DWQ36_10705 [Acidobacteria bacterium]|nr:MAG: hypothetical protein DWQ36_10705 [Acidobacteriota bacterium]
MRTRDVVVGRIRGSVCCVLFASALIVGGFSNALLGGAPAVETSSGSAEVDEEAEPTDAPVGTLAELMSLVILPTSNALLYAPSRPPEDEAGWLELQGQALTLAEISRSLLDEEWALDDDVWVADTRLMIEAAKTGFEAAKARDLDALLELNEPLYQTCVTCHDDYAVSY